MAAEERWFVSRIAFAETLGALIRDLGADGEAARDFEAEWRHFDVVEVVHGVVERAARLVGAAGLRTLDAVHLASALALPDDGLVLATWDRRLWNAAESNGLSTLPTERP